MYLCTSLTKSQRDGHHDNAKGNCCHRQAGIQGYKHKKTNDKMFMSCATKQKTPKSKQMRQWNTLAFCCIFLLGKLQQEKKKKHFLFMTIITTAWLMHYKTKIKDEKGTWQLWALLIVLA